MDGLQDESSQSASEPKLMEISTGKVLSKEEMPYPEHLHEWLESHPGWQIVSQQQDDDDDDMSGDEDSEDEQESSKILCLCIVIIH